MVPGQTLKTPEKSLGAGRHVDTSTQSVLCSHCTLKQMISFFEGGGGESNK